MRVVSRRAAGLAAAAVASLILAGPALASGTAIQFGATGLGAEAGFTNAPLNAPGLPGVTYTDTNVAAAVQGTRYDTGRSVSDFLFFDQFTYQVSAMGFGMPVSETVGEADGSAVALAVANKLTSATASASVPVSRCTFDVNYNESCTPSGSLPVSATWQGTGSLTKIVSRSFFHTKGTTDVSSQRETMRSATPAVSVAGVPIADPVFFADIFNASSKETCISHTGGCFTGP